MNVNSERTTGLKRTPNITTAKSNAYSPVEDISESRKTRMGASYLPNSRYEINSSVLKGKSEKKG